MKKTPKYLLWFDFETDGLWREDGSEPWLLEMSAILLPFGVFDRNEALFVYERVFTAPEHVLQAMVPFVVDMHTKNGLLAEVRDATARPKVAETELIELLEAHHVNRQDVALAGSGIAAFDVPLVRSQMPALYDYVHYAPYDLGTARRMFDLLFPHHKAEAPRGSETHRAMEDVLDQLAEAAWFRKNTVLGIWMSDDYQEDVTPSAATQAD